LEPNHDAKVVDLGCGDGEFSLKVKERIGCNKICGIDVHEPYINKAKMKGIDVIKHDLNDFPYPLEDNSFDVVVSNQVIEHLLYPVKFLKEIYRILKPGGYTVISTENLASWDSIVSLILGWMRFSMELDEVHKVNPLSLHHMEPIKKRVAPHLRILTYKTLLEIVKSIGFKVESALGSGHIFGRIGEIIDKRHCRFVIIRMRK